MLTVNYQRVICQTISYSSMQLYGTISQVYRSESAGIHHAYETT